MGRVLIKPPFSYLNATSKTQSEVYFGKPSLSFCCFSTNVTSMDKVNGHEAMEGIFQRLKVRVM